MSFVLLVIDRITHIFQKYRINKTYGTLNNMANALVSNILCRLRLHFFVIDTYLMPYYKLGLNHAYIAYSVMLNRSTVVRIFCGGSYFFNYCNVHIVPTILFSVK